jgi:hypothetical protein
MASSKPNCNEEVKGLRGLAMYSRRSTPALLMMVLLAVPVGGGAHSQPISTSAGAVIDVTVVPLKNGKPPQEVQCVQEVTVVKGTASIQTFTGKRRELHEGEKVCITPTGDLTTSTALLIPIPPGGGVTPPCVTKCNGNGNGFGNGNNRFQ